MKLSMATPESAKTPDDAPATVRPAFDVLTFARQSTREPETTTKIPPLALEALRRESSRPEPAPGLDYSAHELVAQVHAAQDVIAAGRKRKRRRPRAHA